MPALVSICGLESTQTLPRPSGTTTMTADDREPIRTARSRGHGHDRGVGVDGPARRGPGKARRPPAVGRASSGKNPNRRPSAWVSGLGRSVASSSTAPARIDRSQACASSWLTAAGSTDTIRP